MFAAALTMIPEELTLLFPAAVHPRNRQALAVPLDAPLFYSQWRPRRASSSHDETKLDAVSVYEPRAGVSEPFRPALSPEG
jgi:hypothetical protein